MAVGVTDGGGDGKEDSYEKMELIKVKKNILDVQSYIIDQILLL